MQTYIEDIFDLAVSNITTGSTVGNIVANNDSTYTFTTDNLNNAYVGLDLINGANRVTITAISERTNKITVNGLIENGTWQLAVFFRFGHRAEINETIKSNDKSETYRKQNFPFIWLFSDYKKTNAENWDSNDYDANLKLAFVNITKKDLKASERLTLKFKTVIDTVSTLFFAELNKLPISQYFDSGLKTINGDFYDRFFYGSTDKNQNVFDLLTDARECELDLTVKLPFSNCSTPLKPYVAPSFSYIDNSDAEAFTDELFTARINLLNTTNSLRPVDYSITFDWGTLGSETFTGTLGFGESVNLESAKVLTDITGNYTVEILGSVTGSIVRDVVAPAFELIENGTDDEAFTDELFTIRKILQNTTNSLRPVDYSITFDWGALGKETFTGTLGFGESVNLESAKVLTDITGNYTVEISGSVTDSIILNVKLRNVTVLSLSNVCLYKEHATFSTSRTNPADYPLSTTSFFSIKTSSLYLTARQFNKFEIDSLLPTITEAFLYCYSPTIHNNVGVIAQLSTGITTLSVNNFNTFSTELGQGNIFETIEGLIYVKIPLNVAALNILNNHGTIWICVRNYEHDYLNVAPSIIGSRWASAVPATILELSFN